MIRYENECVGCPPEMGCVSYCKYKHVPHYYCDVCGEECEPGDLFKIDGNMTCESCARANFSFRELLEDVYETVQ